MSKIIGSPKAGKCRRHPVQAIDRIEFLAPCGLNTSPEFKGIKTCMLSSKAAPSD